MKKAPRFVNLFKINSKHLFIALVWSYRVYNFSLILCFLTFVFVWIEQKWIDLSDKEIWRFFKVVLFVTVFIHLGYSLLFALFFGTPQDYRISRSILRLLFSGCFWFYILKGEAIKKKVIHRILFETRDPRFMHLRDFGLSKRIVDVLFDTKRVVFLCTLITMVIYTPEDLLEIEGLEAKDKEEIFTTIELFINKSWVLTALFYCNFHRLKGKPWWYRLIVYISRKRKDPAFLLISELGLSTRIRSVLMEEGIYTIEDLLMILKDTHNSGWRRLVRSEDLAYIDLIEIYTTLHYFLHYRNNKKSSSKKKKKRTNNKNKSNS